ncbi:flavodoxin domain-containing protein [Bacillus massilinigeriensis]|uniref:flavodoxin domain-containing protein n=1 Tax=Bacillus mediterraneensis TaxID=1805474 RepID=UPI0008F8101B|nr:flavodoxin domain-containing protein [Bacillus mediterraneensis]
MKAVVIFASITGNTREVAEILAGFLRGSGVEVVALKAAEFRWGDLESCDIAVVASYTWGDGELPLEMESVFRAFEEQNVGSVVTGIAGTGDSFYPYFCGAVDRFRDMLYVHTDLAATLKIELAPQERDIERCRKFVETLLARVRRRCKEKAEK